jgi:vancomycin resistance protein VanW
VTAPATAAKKQRRLFCEINPFCYRISLWKEWLLRDLRDFAGHEKYARRLAAAPLPALIKTHESLVVRILNGVDRQLQENKAVNLRLAIAHINGLVIHPGETFSFWKLIGNTTSRKGYLDGLVLTKGKIEQGIGGGLCQLANMVHWLALNSPLTVTEIWHHTDALFPDSNRRVPFGTGTSVFYKHRDYRFKNTTEQDVQLILYLQDGYLQGELRAQRPFPQTYQIAEEDAGYRLEGQDFYRVSRVYRYTVNADGSAAAKELVLDNHSKVMYDHALIPQGEIIYSN